MTIMETDDGPENVSIDDHQIEDEVGHMEEEARRRKERIQRLREASVTGGEDDNNRPSQGEMKLPTPIFRNYQPSDESLRQLRLSKGQGVPPPSLEEELHQQVNPDEEEVNPDSLEEVGLENLAPKPVDWDLKRIIEKPLHRLERRTQRAIAELIRERIQKEVQEEGNPVQD